MQERPDRGLAQLLQETNLATVPPHLRPSLGRFLSICQEIRE